MEEHKGEYISPTPAHTPNEGVHVVFLKLSRYFSVEHVCGRPSTGGTLFMCSMRPEDKYSWKSSFSDLAVGREAMKQESWRGDGRFCMYFGNMIYPFNDREQRSDYSGSKI